MLNEQLYEVAINNDKNNYTIARFLQDNPDYEPEYGNTGFDCDFHDDHEPPAIPGVGLVLDCDQPTEGNGSGHAGKIAKVGETARLQIEACGHARALGW